MYDARSSLLYIIWSKRFLRLDSLWELDEVSANDSTSTEDLTGAASTGAAGASGLDSWPMEKNFLKSSDSLSFESNFVVSTPKSPIEFSDLSFYFLWCLFFLWCFFFLCYWVNFWCLWSIASYSFWILFLSASSSYSFSNFSYCFFWTSSIISSSADFDF